MSTILAAQNGNWHDGSTWTGGVVPGPSDVAVVNGKAIAIAANVTCQQIRNDNTGGATHGGTCTISVDGVTVTAALFGGIVATTFDAVIDFDAPAPAVLNLIGDQTGAGSAGNACYVSRNLNSGTVNVTGNILGAAYNRAICRNHSTGTINLTGTIQLNYVTSCGLGNYSTGALIVNGDQNVTIGTPISLSGTGPVTINGNLTAGENVAAVISVNAAASITVNGKLTSSSKGGAIDIGSTSGVSVTFRELDFGPIGIFPIKCTSPASMLFQSGYPAKIRCMGVGPTPRMLYEAQNEPTYPTAANVRSGVAYGPDNTLTGACAVPPPESVAFGVPTGSDTGTLQLDPDALALAVWAASARSLTDKEGFGASAADTAAAVWATEVRSLTDKQGFGATPAEVWGHETRTLTGSAGGGASAEDIWAHPQRTLTEMPLTAADVWQYQDRVITEAPAIEGVLGDVWESVAGIQGRIAEQVTSGPVVVVPSPAEGQTTAWCLCYRGDGTLAPNISVEIWIEGAGKGGHGLFSSERRTVTADENGMLSFAIPRNTLLRFALQAANGQKVSFQGVDADTLELPIIIA